MSPVRIYVEGGGDGRVGKSEVRKGFQEFFREFADVMPAVIPCGGRNQAYDDFRTALRKHPEAFVILLVDAEGPVLGDVSCRAYLKSREKWDLRDVDEDQVHLMVQAVEAWLIADPDAIAAFYGNGVNMNAIPTTRNPEDIPKDTLKSSLDNAGKHTQKRGYHEINHCPKILAAIRAAVVRERCAHCKALFDVLCRIVGIAKLPTAT
ncbi:MAG TPA: hypothetical protein DGT21_20200 [Armatimonadetes bacterium]|jgi:hypothetical protein|nr:hypothetical protein [Armatimonadota bacterium]